MTVGVVVSTSTLPGPGSVDAAPGAAYLAVYQTLRGNPTVPTKVTSLDQYRGVYGAAVGWGFGDNDMQSYFGEAGNGGVAWVQRVVGADATAGTVTLNDGSPTPQPTLELQAGCQSVDPVAGTNLGNVADPGSWSANVSVQPVASLVSGYWNLLVFYNGAQVEQWGPFDNVAAAVATINSSSSYLVATNLFSDGTSPNPAAAADPVSLSAGNDQRGSIEAATMGAALASFVSGIGPGYVAIPGYDLTLVGDAIEAHCNTYGRAGHLSFTQGVSPTSAMSAAAAFRGTTGSQAVAAFWPWVTIPNGQGGSIAVPPDGFVAGRRSATIQAIGAWQPPAGGNYGAAQFVTGLNPAAGVVTDTLVDTMDAQQVNVIKPIAGNVALYGWDSLSLDSVNFPLLSQQDELNILAYQLQQALLGLDYDIIDAGGQLFSSMTTEALGVLGPLIAAGALYPGPTGSDGNPSDPGYEIDTSMNNAQTAGADEALINVYVRLVGAAKLISVGLIKVALGTQF